MEAFLIGKAKEKVADPVVNEIVDSIWRQIMYVWKYKSNIGELDEKVQLLKATRDGVLHEVKEAIDEGKEIEKLVEMWLTRVKEALDAADEILIVKEEAKGGCFCGCDPDLKTRYTRSKKTEKEILPKFEDVLLNKHFTRISHRVPVQDLALPEDYEVIDSRTQVLEKIVAALKDGGGGYMVGLFGLGGVGKSTLLKQLTSHVKAGGLFKTVAAATVTHTPDYKKIQQQIADWLDFPLDVDSPGVRAARLLARLQKEERVLVILDDIWAQNLVKLDEIGIPCGDDHEGCKVLMTSRSQDALLQMKVKKDHSFMLDALNSEEALCLFQKKVGTLEDPVQIQPILIEVVKRCGGLPLLIETVATALQGKEIFEWQNALEDLQSPDEHGLDGQVYKGLQLSFKFLKDEEKSLFLLCSLLLPNEIDISDLLKFSIGLGIFNQRSRSLLSVESVRNKLLTVVSELKKSCMLVEGDNPGVYKMHDHVHNFSASVASEKDHVFALAYNTKLEEWQMDNTFEQCTAISLPFCDLELPQELNCPDLRTFILYSKDPSLRIPDHLFSLTKSLSILQLVNLKLPTLPLSLQFLENLLTLCLDYCILEDIRSVGKLKKLYVLSLRGSTISQLPTELKELTRLLFLDLSDCGSLEVIPQSVIKHLANLECLYMGNSFVRWEGDGHVDEANNVNLIELKTLPKLANMEIHVLDANILPSGLFSKDLEIFKIFIGDNWDWNGKYETSATLKLKINSRNQLEKIKAPLMNTKDLYLDDLKGFEDVLPGIDAHGFPKLKHLHFQNSHEIQYIIDWNKMGHLIAFCSLESLSLHNLNGLKKICNGKFSNGSLDNLKKLKVEHCNELTHLFSFSMFKCLAQLREIYVSSCQKMKAILDDDADEDDARHEIVELTKLYTLTLEDLPQFAGFWSEAEATKEASGEILLTKESRQIRFPSLVDLKLSSVHVERIWHGQFIEVSSFESLTTLIVDGCGDVRYMLTYSMVGSLSQLKHIEICDCNSMEEVIKTGGIVKEVIFPKLGFLKLKGLPKLVRFVACNFIRCPTLKVLRIENCPQLGAFTDLGSHREATHRDFTLFDEKVLFPELEEIYILYMHKLKMIWNEELGSNSFCRLKLVKVEHDEELLKIFPSKQLRRFKNVESLFVERCDSLEEVFDLQSLIVSKERHDVVACQLRTLSLRKLRKLKHIWNGDPQQFLSFRNLSSVVVTNCISLGVVLPVSVARNLHELEQLTVENCGVKEIITKKEDELESSVAFEFPQLKFLYLSLLQITSFYNGSHTLYFPELKRLGIYLCAQFDLFAFTPQVQEQLHLQSPSTIPFRQPLLSSATFPELEEITMNSRDISVLRQGQFRIDGLLKLKVVRLQEFHDSMELPFDLLGKFLDLHALAVESSNFQELFPNDIVDETESNTLGHIRYLKLTHLPHMTHVSKQDSQPLRFFQNLHTLRIMHCKSLVSLEGFSSSFDNLSALDVWNCESLLNLGTRNAISSLVNLTRMSIRVCKKMKQIIVAGKNATLLFQSDEIVFKKLQFLELHCLKRLTSFCSATCPIKFPSLVQISVVQCPNMKIFSEGIPSAPELKKVYVTKEEDKGRWIGDLNTTIERLYTESVGFNGLEELTLSEYPQLKKEWLDQLPLNFSYNLRELTLDKYLYSSIAVPPNLLPFLNNLESLVVRDSSSVEQVFGLPSANGNEFSTYMSNLKQLFLIDLTRLMGVSNEVPDGSLDFKNLKILAIFRCNSLTYILTPGMSLGLLQLEELEVQKCNRVEEIVTENNALSTLKFCNLKSVKLTDLPKLSRFCTCDLIECCSLKELSITNCPQLMTFVSNSAPRDASGSNEVDLSSTVLFDKKVVLPILEKMEIAKANKVTMIWHKELHSDSFSKLKELKLADNEQLIKIFPSNVWRRLQNLEKFEIKYCQFVEVLFDFEEYGNTEVTGTVKSLLRKVEIFNLQNLKHVWNKDPSKLVSFNELNSVHILNCPILNKNIFPASVASALPQLKFLRIGACGVEEIVAKVEGPKTTPQFVFPELDALKLEGLKNLKYFYNGNHTLESPNLKTLDVLRCDSLQMFCANDNLQDKDTGIQPLFSVLQEHLETCSIDLSYCFKNLTSLRVDDCRNFKYVFQSSVVGSLTHLEELKICNCKMMEAVLIMESSGETTLTKMPLNQLKSLELRNLPQLSRFCMSDLLECPALKELSIRNCPQLVTFVSKSASTQVDIPSPALFDEKVAFPMLERMEILEVDNMKTIWHKNLHSDSFSKLKELKLGRDKQLTKIFPFSIWRRLGNLEDLVIENCHCVEVFEFQEVSTANIRIVESQLKKLKIDNLENLKCIWNKGLSGLVLFDKLISVDVSSCPSLNNIFLASIASDLPHLESLQINWCGVEELIVEVEGAEATPRFVYPQLETLVLSDLENLKYLFKGNQSLECPKLNTLTLFNCVSLQALGLEYENRQETTHMEIQPHLSNLQVSHQNQLLQTDLENGSAVPIAPSSDSCRNLTILSVQICHGLVSLLTFSAAKSLAHHLKEMIVYDGDKLKTIVANNGYDESEKEIVFMNLETLELRCLPSLVSFCSEEHSFKFPSLTSVKLECSSMQFFCQGDVDTPNLRSIMLIINEDYDEEENARLWNGNLNDTLRKLYTEQHATEN